MDADKIIKVVRENQRDSQTYKEALEGIGQLFKRFVDEEDQYEQEVYQADIVSILEVVVAEPIFDSLERKDDHAATAAWLLGLDDDPNYPEAPILTLWEGYKKEIRQPILEKLATFVNPAFNKYISYDSSYIQGIFNEIERLIRSTSLPHMQKVALDVIPKLGKWKIIELLANDLGEKNFLMSSMITAWPTEEENSSLRALIKERVLYILDVLQKENPDSVDWPVVEAMDLDDDDIRMKAIETLGSLEDIREAHIEAFEERIDSFEGAVKDAAMEVLDRLKEEMDM